MPARFCRREDVMGVNLKVWRSCRSLAVLAAFAVLLALMVIPASAQEAGVILGVVKDASGGVVPNANVTVTSAATGATRTVTSGADGAYRVPALQPGVYNVKIEAQGFQTTTVTNLNLHVAEELVANATLQVGAATQEVTVTGEAPVINTTTSSLGNLINDQTISELPLNGRNYTDLTLLAPGIVQATHSGLGDSGLWYSSNGAPPRSNNYMLDGAVTVTKNGTGPASVTQSTLGVDGIKEYRVVTQTPSAEYGLLMGSQMVIVSKSGTNKWTGSVFEYLRNNHLDARNFFAPQADVSNKILTDASGNPMRNAQFKRNNFGGALGGPIQKDKTFFFFTYEGLRFVQGDTIQSITLPLACHVMTNGGVTSIIGGGNIPAADLAKLQAAYPGITQKILQAPMSGSTTLANVNGLGLSPFNSTCVGKGAGTAVSTLVQPWIGQFPAPNELIPGSNNNYTFNGDSRAREDYGQLRVDHNFSANDTFFTRYTISDGKITTPYLGGNLGLTDVGPAYPQYSPIGKSRNQYVTLGENHIFSPMLLNSFRLSFSRMIYNNLFQEQNSPMNPDFFLKDDTSKCFYIVPGDPAHDGSTAASSPTCVWSFVPGKFTGGFNPGSPFSALTPPGTFPNYHYNNVWALDDDVFYTHGKHALKFGTLLTRMNQPHLQSKSVFGNISFGNITNFLNGNAQNFNIVGPGTGAGDPNCVSYLPCDLLSPEFGNGGYMDRSHTWYTIGMYVQDDFRATSRLTLNLGVRYEFMTHISELYNRQSTVPDIHTSVNPQVVPDGIWRNDTYYKNISPRIGVAWDVFGNGKTALRSGFGIYYDIANIGALLTQNSTGVLPFVANTTFQAPSVPGFVTIHGPGECVGQGLSQACATLPLQPVALGAVEGRSLQMGDYNTKSPKSLQYNVTIEQQLPLGVGLAVSYVGRRGINLYTSVEGNPVVPIAGTGQNGVAPLYDTTKGKAGCFNQVIPVDANGIPQPFKFGGVVVDSTDPHFPCRVNPFFGSALFFTNGGSSWYNSLQLNVTKRLTRGLSFQGAYTYSRSTDTTQGTRYNDDCGGPAQANFGHNPYDLRMDYGPSCFDVPHSAHVQLIYHTPNLTSNGMLSKIVNGWWVGNLVSVTQGTPFVPIVNQDRSFSGIVSQNPASLVSLNTVANGQFIPYDPATVITGNPNQWYNPFMFGVPALGHQGNAPRGILRNPGLGTWDFSINKETKLGFLGEGGNLGFRAEFFNILNRANFSFLNSGVTAFNATTTTDCPAGSVSCNLFAPAGGAGQIQGTATTARQIQFALRLSF
jgi:hypothetical protein